VTRRPETGRPTSRHLAVAERHALSRPGDLVHVKIGRERLGAALAIHHGYVAVGPHEINGIALQAAPAHTRLPTENMQRQSSLFTYCPDLEPGVAVDVYLPVQRCQRLEVVVVEPTGTRLNPWQPVPAVQPPGAPLAQRACAIVHRRLRDGTKH